MPRRVRRPPRGVWKLVARVQRVGLSEGVRGKGGGWIALGVGAWGLQRLRNASNPTEILISEAVRSGERVEIVNLGITRKAYDKQRRREAKAVATAEKQAAQQAKADRKAARRAKRKG